MKEPRPHKCAVKSSILSAACGLLCFLWLGCLAAPVRVTTHTVGQSGEHDHVELGFLHAGSSSKSDVVQQLGWTDTQAPHDRLFWGRWMESKWAVATAVYGGGASADRVWEVRNLIVEFDEKGTVTAYRQVADHELAKELSASLARTAAPTLDFATPVVVSIRHHHGLKSSQSYGSATLSLGKELVSFSEPGDRLHGFSISPHEITAFTYAAKLPGNAPDARNTNYTLHFSTETAAGKKLTMKIDMPALMILVRYLAQNASMSPGTGAPSSALCPLVRLPGCRPRTSS